MTHIPKNLMICAFCPNTCRPSIAAQGLQIESQTPSALSLIAIAVLEGRIALDDQTKTSLARREAIQASVGHCTYGLDMPKVLDDALQGLPT